MTASFLFRLLSCVLLILAAGPIPAARGQTPPDRFDGSFRMESGETITGGYFVENAQGRYLYMDAGGLRRGGLFERAGDTTLDAIVPPGTRIHLLPGDRSSPDSLLWIEMEGDTVRGVRVHPHDARDVRFGSGDGTVLSGRLLTPRCPGPHPVVVSVHGSGPVDRHGGPYHTFFLQHGIAVLAYDKRGYATDRSDWREPDLRSLSADAAAAVRFAARQPDLDGARIGLFGSSQAGWVVPRAAIDAAETDFLILRAGAAVSGIETVLHEVRQELRAEGLAGSALDQAVQLRREIYEAAARGLPLSATDSIVGPYLDETWYRTAFGEGAISTRWSSRYWSWLQENIAIAGTTALRHFGGPVLWFLAEQDEAVPLVPTRAGLERAFAVAPGDDHTIVVLEDALHSFLIPSADGPPRFSPGFFDRMADWLERRGLTSPCPGGD